LDLFAGRPGSGGRWRRWIGWWQRHLSRLAARFTPIAVLIAEFVPIPSGILYAAAGWEGMNLAAFLFFDAIGEMLWGGLLIWLGYGFGRRAVQVVDTISRFGLWIALAIIAVVVGRVVWSTWRGRHPVPPSAAP
ncbi:MAG: DedA family protein, partial [Candidatus Dormibacteraceae bacterium]